MHEHRRRIDALVVSRHEPPRRIEFTCFVADLYVMRLKIGPASTAVAASTDDDEAPRL